MAIMPPEGIAYFRGPVTTFFNPTMNVTTTIAQYSASRCFLMIACSPLSQAFYVAPRAGITPLQGINIAVGNQYLIFTFQDHGAIVNQAWYAVTANPGPNNITVIEMFYQPPDTSGGVQ